MGHANNLVPQIQSTSSEPSRVVEIGVAPDGASFSILAGGAVTGPAEVLLPSEEIPRLIVALLRAAALSQRASGHNNPLVFPVETGALALWGREFVFTVTLTEGADMTFRLDHDSAAALLQALTMAFLCPSLTHSAAH